MKDRRGVISVIGMEREGGRVREGFDFIESGGVE